MKGFNFVIGYLFFVICEAELYSAFFSRKNAKTQRRREKHQEFVKYEVVKGH